jgi:hypothetical protein
MRAPACFILLLLSSAAFAASSDMRWQFDGISLTHGVPQTDDSDFSASCATGKTVIYLHRAAPGLSDGGSIGIALAAGSFSGRYAGHGVMSDEAGVVLPELTLPSGDGLVDAMAKGQSLRVTMDGAAAYDIPLQGSHATVARFAAACGHATSSPRRSPKK